MSLFGILITLCALTGVDSDAGSLEVRLREAAELGGPRVLLRDVAELSGPQEQVARLGAVDLGAVPAAGAERVLNPAGVLLAVRKAGLALDRGSLTGARRSVLRGRWTRWEPQPAIDEALRFARRALRDSADRVVVRPAGESAAVSLLEAEGEWSFDARWASRARGPGRVEVQVEIYRGRAVVGELLVPLEVEQYTRALRLLRPIARGEVVTAAMVSTAEVSSAEFRGLPVTALDELRDHVARRDLGAATVLEQADFQPRLVVRRGEQVRVVHQVGGLRVVVRGIAQRDGRVGELIAVRNPDSGKDLMVRLVGGGDGGAVVARLQ